MNVRADMSVATDTSAGAPPSGGGADVVLASDGMRGPDPVTVLLASLGAMFEDVQRTRKSHVLRAIAAEKNGQLDVAAAASAIAEALLPIEQRVSRDLKKTLRKHALYPWLSRFPGVAGPTTGRLIGIIADPLRFPGVKCEAGHYWPETYGGEVCVADRSSEDDTTGGPCLAPVHRRSHSGVRSLWHYLGLHAVDGKSPRLRKGQQGDWNPLGRTLCLMPDGLAAQIVKHRVAPYRSVYDETKARLQRERGVVEVGESETSYGPALSIVAEGAEQRFASDSSSGPLRPIQIEGIARKVAVKRFVGDLLIEWKGLVR